MRGLFLLMGLTSGGDLLAQKEGYVWAFGANAGLDFNTLPANPATINTAGNSIEGTGSICDGAGNLLFYTNGLTV